MAVGKGKKSGGIFSLRGGQVDLAIGVLAYAILESQAAHAEGLPFGGLDRLSDPALAQQVNGLLHQAVATNDIHSLSVEELRALLTPEHLAELGIDAQEFTYLLEADPAAALAKLEAAFAGKLKLASFEAAHKSVANFAAHEDAGGLGQDGGAGSGGGGGLSPALIIGGVIAAGVGVGFLVGSGGGNGGQGGQGGQAVNSPPLANADAVTTTEDAPITFDPRTNDTDANGNALTITQVNGTAITATAPVTIAGVGVVSLNANGTLTFTPVANFNGAPTFTYTVSDGNGGSTNGNITVTVSSVNDAPVAVNDTVTTAEDTAITFDPRTNDTDVDGTTKTITAINGAAITTTTPVAIAGVGVVSLNANGTLTFTPAANFSGTPSFTYTISDGAGGTATGTVGLTVTAVNDAPVAVNDTVTTAEDTAITFDPRANDSDVDSSALSITQINGTAITTTAPVTITGVGVVSLNADGTLTFTPAANFNGTPSFTYTLSDGAGGTATGTVSLNVTAVNDAPVAVADTVTTAEEAPVTFDPRTNDTDVDGVSKTITAINGTAITTTTPVTIAGVGVVSLNADGTLTFTPVVNFSGTPSFTYTLSDGAGGTATGTVNLNVTGVNDAPVNTVPVSLSGAQNTTIPITGLSVSDVDSPLVTYTLHVGAGQLFAGSVTGGVASIIGGGTDTLVLVGSVAQINATLGSITYQGGATLSGSLTLTVTTTDGALTDTDSFTLNIAAVNVQAIALSDGYIDGATVFIDVNGNGVPDEGEPVGVPVAGEPGHYLIIGNGVGSLTAFGGTNTDTGLPNNLVLKAPFGASAVNPLTTVIEALLEANPGLSLSDANALLVQSLGLPAGTDLLNLDILSSSTDPALQLAAQKAAAQIALTLDAAVTHGGSQADLLAKLADLYATGDPVDLGNPATLSDLFSGIGISADAVEGLALSAASSNQAVEAATSLDDIAQAQEDAADPNHDFAPVTADDSVTTSEDTPVTFNPLANDVDPEGGALTITAINGTAITTTTPVTIPGVGVVSLNADGTLTFTPAANFNGTPSFTYTASDAAGGTTTGTVDLSVTAVNDAPVAVNDAITTVEDAPVTFDPRANDTDVDSTIKSITAINGTAITTTTPVTIAGVGVVSLNADGTLTFTPVANFNGTPSFTYTVTDDAGGTSTGTVNLNVTSLNDAPVAVNDAVTTAEDTPITFDPRANDSDVDSALSITQINGTAITTTTPVTITGVGVVSLNANGTLTFTPAANFNGTPSFTYTLSDGAGGTATGTVNLNVTSVNDAPVAINDTVTTVEDAPVTFDPRANDTDVDGTIKTITAINGTAISATTPVTIAGVGVVSLNGDGTLTFTPAANFNGTPSFTYTLSDGAGGTATGTVSLNVTAVNDAPVAVNDAITTAEDAPVTFDPRANDTDVDGTIKTITQINGTAITTTTPVTIAGAGVVSLNANGTLTFTPSANFNGTPSFTYTIVDEAGATSTGTVNLNVTAVNDAPVAVNDAVTTAEDTPVTFDPRTNDTDVDGPTKVVTQINGTAITTTTPVAIIGVGVVSLNANGTLTFTPAANFNGTPSFTYTLSDGAGGTSTGTVNLNVTAVNDLPVVGADTATGTENAPFTFNPLANDSDPEGGPLTITAINGVQIFAGMRVSVSGGTVSLGTDGGLVFEPNDNFRGPVPTFTYTATDSSGGSTVGEINLTLTASDTYVTSAAGIGAVAGDAQNLADLGYLHIDVGGAGASVDVSLSDIQAGALISAGLDFVVDDHVTVETEGTTTSTSLKGLQDLHVDTVNVHASSFSIDAGAGGLGGLDAGSLPTFVAADGGPLDINLDIASGTLGADVDLGALVPALSDAGIDHIDVTGSGEFTLSADQALSFIGSGVDFVAGDEITITTDAADIATVVGNAGGLAGVNIDHIDVTGDSITIDDGQASSLINAGLDFVTGDEVTVETAGTTTSTTLKGLQDLHVDAVNVHASSFSIDAGADGLGGLTATGLPSFTLGQSDAAVDISLNISGGTLDPSVDLGALAPALGAAGIDHIDVTGSGSLTLSADQALSLIHSGVDFVSSDDITLSASASDVVAVVGSAGDLGGVHVDHIDVTGDSLTIDDTQASALVAAGLDFVDGDNITVEAHGTHVSTSVAGLQSLHVDTVTSDESVIKLALGDADPTVALPHFDPSKDVIVDLSQSQTDDLSLSDIDNLTNAAHLLHDAGVDKIGISQSFDTLTQDQLDTISQLETTTGIDFVYDPSPVPTSDFGTLLSLLESHPIEPDVPGVIAVSDAATASLIESGALQSFLGETLVVDATDSGDHLLTSLKSLADLGVDNVLLADHGPAPVYVDLGFSDATPTTSELTELLNTVDPTGDNEPLFSGASHVGLVVDQAALDALAGVDGSLGHLADLGFTEIDVLGGTSVPDALLHDSGIEIKLIGVDDDLYEHLHHDR